MTQETVAPATGQPRWARLQAVGLVMAAAGPLLMFLALVIFGLEIGSDAPFFIIPSVIGLVTAYLVLRYGTWAKIVGAVVGFLIAGMLFWTAFGLQAPQSFFDFMPGLLVIPGGLIALIAGIGAAVAKRRGNVSERPVGMERGWIRGVTYVLVLGALVSGGLTATGRSSADDSNAAATVIAKNFEWNSLQYRVVGGSSVFVRNDDPFLHTFTVDELDIDVTLTPGDKALITIPSKSGILMEHTYIMYCRPHSDPDDPEVPTSLNEDDDGGDMAARFIVT